MVIEHVHCKTNKQTKRTSTNTETHKAESKLSQTTQKHIKQKVDTLLSLTPFSSSLGMHVSLVLFGQKHICKDIYKWTLLGMSSPFFTLA